MLPLHASLYLFEKTSFEGKTVFSMEVVSMQDSLENKSAQLQNQVAMNQQLMKRKEDMEWQLMSVLAQVPVCLLACTCHGCNDRMLSG